MLCSLVRWWSQLINVAMCSVHWIESHFQTTEAAIAWFGARIKWRCVRALFFQSEKESAAPFRCVINQLKRRVTQSPVWNYLDGVKVICVGIFRLWIELIDKLSPLKSYHHRPTGEGAQFSFVFLSNSVSFWVTHSMISGLYDHHLDLKSHRMINRPRACSTKTIKKVDNATQAMW